MNPMIDTHVGGIPCCVVVTTFHHQAPLGPWRADNPADCYGYTEIEFEIRDRKGCPAPWLERKLMAEDQDRIRDEIRSHMLDYV